MGVLIHILICLVGLYVAFALDDNWKKRCEHVRDASDNYNEIVDQVLTNISSKNATPKYGFVSSSAGKSPYRVNGIALCRPDIGPDECVKCLGEAKLILKDHCRNRKEGIGWHSNCMLRYSNRSIFNTMEASPVAFLWNRSHSSNSDQFDAQLVPFLEQLQRKATSAAGGGGVRGLGKFATDKKYLTDPNDLTVYALVQCTPDLSKSGCRDCLDSAINSTHYYCYGRIGATIYKPSCVIRYETYLFYNEARVDPPTAAPAPSVEMPPPVAVVLPPATDGPLPIAVAPAADVPSTVDQLTTGPGGKNRKKIVAIAAATLAAAATTIILVLGVYRWCHIKRKQEERILLHGSEAPTSIEGISMHQSDEEDTGEIHFFNLKTIQEATNNFSIETKLGEGGFGPVYKGELNDGRVVAVKRLSKNSGQGLQEFKTEVRLIVKLQHKNLVRLLGCCTQKGEKLLIYEFMPNNSLDTFLFDQTKCRELDWPTRANIVGGIAKGLRYLHEDSRLKIVHRDMKASNVLLDDDMNAKISDFGTARIFGGNQIEANTNRIVGTYGYMSPEYAMEGVFSTKSDVYSFGVLLLEIISGQRNSGFYHPEHLKSLLSHAWRMWKEGTAEQLIDENIMESCLVSEALRWTNIALLCVQEDPNDRPTMSSVVFMLEGQWTSLPQPSEPPFSAVRFIKSDQSSSTDAAAGFFVSTQPSTSASNTN